MSKYVKHHIDITGIDKDDLNALKTIIEDHAFLFEDTIMGSFGGDTRYTYEADSFEVDEIHDGDFSIKVDVSYYEGCKDKDDCDSQELSVSYEILGNEIVFELDETVWKSN